LFCIKLDVSCYRPAICLTKIRELNEQLLQTPGKATWEKLVIQCLFGIINARRNLILNLSLIWSACLTRPKKTINQNPDNAYNNLRPHMSCDYLTPNQAHLTTEPLIKHWKNRRKKASQQQRKGIY